MTEAQFQTKFNKWLYGNWSLGTATFELKLTKSNRIRIDAVKPHQIHGLHMSGEKMAYKIADVGLAQKPFDCFFLEGVPGFVVIGFYVPTKKGITLYVIPFFEWTACTAPSLTQEECASRAIVSAVI